MKQERTVTVLLWTEGEIGKRGFLIKIEVADQVKFFTMSRRSDEEVNKYRKRRRGKGCDRDVEVSSELIGSIRYTLYS